MLAGLKGREAALTFFSCALEAGGMSQEPGWSGVDVRGVRLLGTGALVSSERLGVSTVIWLWLWGRAADCSVCMYCGALSAANYFSNFTRLSHRNASVASDECNTHLLLCVSVCLCAYEWSSRIACTEIYAPWTCIAWTHSKCCAQSISFDFVRFHVEVIC